jgi:class 3 adenylate cyclase/predicted ATPase
MRYPDLKAVIHGLKPATPATARIQRCRWQAEGQRNILFLEGLPLLGAEDHRMDVAVWLQSLGLERYASAFRDNDVDAEVLPELTADDLIGLGVTSIGHRRKLLAAIAALGIDLPAATVPAAPRDAPAQADAERRQLTVMFCDLVGSTALAARLDPEDLREVIATYHRTVAEIVAGFDGFVAKYMGDGVLIYFGYPRAHEDDAERAARAGLGLIDAVGRLDVKSVKVQARVGIATGLVVVGDLIGEGSAQEQSVVGETPNLAARLQALAEPDAVVIASSTRRLVGDLFEYRDLGAVEVKGLAEPVPAWRVLRPSLIASRFEALRGSALTPLIGRDEEVDLLLRRWARAKAGDGQVVLISGEPGLGKSRITAALAERLHAEPYLRLRYFCSPYHQDSALFPFIDQLGRASGFARDDPPVAKLEKLEALLARATPPDDDVALLVDLLSLPASERHPLPNLSPQRKKERTLEALIRQLEGLAHQRPVIMVFEDAHWIDPTSRELLDLTVEGVRSLPVLLIVTFRPEFQPPWPGQPQVSTVTLNRLDRHDRAVLVEQIAGGKALPDEVVDQIVDRTDGVPLFVEELTKSVLESGLLREEGDRYLLDGALLPVAIPTTLHDSLLARLDRLSSVRLVSQIGAAIGREFTYALLLAVSRLPEDELQAALGRLVASELVFQRGMLPDAVYAFKHALVQDTAYSTLLRDQRHQLHARIGRVLEERHPELAGEKPEILAHHFAQAGLARQAAEYGLAAGRRAAARLANPEAISHYTRALGVLATIPAGEDRDRLELDLQVELGVPLVSTFGHSAPELEQTYGRARVLSENLPGSPHLFRIVRSLWNSAANAGRSKEALERSEHLLTVADAGKDPVQRAIARRAFGTDLVFQGKSYVGLKLLREGSALWDACGTREEVVTYGDDPGSTGRAYTGWALWFLGFPEQAMGVMSEAVGAAERLSFPFVTAFVFNLASTLDILSGEFASAFHRADKTFAICADHVLPQRVAFALMCSGRALIAAGDAELGHARVVEGFDQWRKLGARTWTGAFGTWAAEACAATGRLQEALAISGQTLDHIQCVNERAFEPEGHRIRGTLLLQVAAIGDAEECFRQALAVAREQRTRSWELRAATSLARLLNDQGRQGEARDLLAPAYGWFTEGFDTLDLKEAKALLDALA